MSEKSDSTNPSRQNQRVTRLNKALRQNLRKRKLEPENVDAQMQRRSSVINKRTGPKLKRPE